MFLILSLASGGISSSSSLWRGGERGEERRGEEGGRGGKGREGKGGEERGGGRGGEGPIRKSLRLLVCRGSGVIVD